MDHFEETVYYAFINFKLLAGLTAEAFINAAEAACNTDEEYTRYLHQVHKMLYISCHEDDKSNYAEWIGYFSKNQVKDWLHH